MGIILDAILCISRDSDSRIRIIQAIPFGGSTINETYDDQNYICVGRCFFLLVRWLQVG
jgi:hypothetical protein